MSRRLGLALLVAALALAAVLAILAIVERPPPLSPVEIVPTTWRTARETPMHALHVGTKKIACNECHAGAGGEDPAPTAASCTKCHAAETKHGHRGNETTPTTCLSCHVFGKSKSVAQCADCHADGPAHGAKAIAHHARADVPCAACHAIHREKGAMAADCTICHDKMTATHGRFSARPSLAPGTEAQHEPTTKTSFDPRAASPAEVCSACHAPHSGKETAPGTCIDCHVGTHAGTGEGDVTPALASRAPKILPRGRGVAGHEACSTCHEPHRTRANDARACESCHADHRTNLGSKGHPTCGACHDAHGPNASPEAACIRCHESVKLSHGTTPSAEGGKACIGCHPPHGDGRGKARASESGSESQTRLACSTCHTSARDDRSFHAKGTTCTQCHAPHAFRLAGAGAAAALCANCHAAKATATANRPGHASCEGCHGGAHAPAAKPSCQSCHASEASTATKGHATCTSCHDAHSGSLGPQKTCTSCHENKKKALHATFSAKSASSPTSANESCASCHRAHGPNGVAQPAACSSCHARSTLSGLHGVGAHAPCETCHSAHGAPRSDRATCTGSCHTDRREHQPAAKVCKGCHVFRH